MPNRDKRIKDIFRDDLDQRQVLVTVLCLVYNHAPYLRQALDGFVAQQTDFRFEVIAHDDCSTDESLSILEEYAGKYPSIIKVLSETENLYSKGGETLRNELRKYQRGKYLAYCEGDDYWIDPLKLQKQADYLEAHPDCGLCYARAKKYHHKTGSFLETIGGPAETFEQELIANRIPTLTVMVRSELVRGYCESDLPRGSWLMGDYPQWLWIAKDHKIHFDNEVTSVYRLLENSASHPVELKKFVRFENNAVDIKLYFVKLCNLSVDDYLTAQDVWTKIRWAILTGDSALLKEYYDKALKKGLRKDLLLLARYAKTGGYLTMTMARSLLYLLFKLKKEDKIK